MVMKPVFPLISQHLAAFDWKMMMEAVHLGCPNIFWQKTQNYIGVLYHVFQENCWNLWWNPQFLPWDVVLIKSIPLFTPNTVYQIQINPGFCGKILLVLVKREVIAFPRSSRRAVGRDLWRPFVSGEARFSGGIHHGGGFVSGVNWWAPEKRDKYFCGKYCSKYCTISPTT